MEFKFDQEINQQKITFEITTAPLTPEDAAKVTLIRGYKCESVKINGENLKNPGFVSCYAQTNRKEGPALCFKFGMAKWLEEHYGITNTTGQALYININENAKADYLKMMAELDAGIERLQKEAELTRIQNDQNVKEDDIIEISYSPQFVRVNYPFDSNRAKEESKIWSQFDGNLDLDDWIELNLEPYCVGLGCGCSKKYKIPYGEYSKLLKAYEKQL